MNSEDLFITRLIEKILKTPKEERPGIIHVIFLEDDEDEN